MIPLYPLKFNPIFKQKIWGGNKIKHFLNKKGGFPSCGESWEISGVSGSVSTVANGELSDKNLSELLEIYQERLVGKKTWKKHGKNFPLLIKFIDANDDLSIQVHPDDLYSLKKYGEKMGKTEMWYIIDSDNDAILISGFKENSSQQAFVKMLKEGKILEVLNQEKVKNGDVFFLPAGRVHNLGKGLLIAEIQQTSDITYRIYDFDRTDNHGNRRALHLEDALEVLDYKKHDSYKTHYAREIHNQSVNMINSPYFTTNKLSLDQNYQISNIQKDCFRIYMCVHGKGRINNTSIAMGESLLIPACMASYEIFPNKEIELLETYISY